MNPSTILSDLNIAEEYDRMLFAIVVQRELKLVSKFPRSENLQNKRVVHLEHLWYNLHLNMLECFDIPPIPSLGELKRILKALNKASKKTMEITEGTDNRGHEVFPWMHGPEEVEAIAHFVFAKTNEAIAQLNDDHNTELPLLSERDGPMYARTLWYYATPEGESLDDSLFEPANLNFF